MMDRAELRFKPQEGHTTAEVVEAILTAEEPSHVYLNGEKWFLVAETVIVDPVDGWAYCAIVKSDGP